jgi:hypothetical protein
MTLGAFPMWHDERKHLVEYGIARFMEGPIPVMAMTPVRIDEPLALVAIVCYFETQHLTLERHIRATLQSNKGKGFEQAVLLAITKLLRGGTKLNQVLEFDEPAPEWADWTAKIVTRVSSGDYVDFAILGRDSVVPSTGLAFYAETPGAVKCWLQGAGTDWCVPGDSMGPDLMAWLRLDDGSDGGKFLC